MGVLFTPFLRDRVHVPDMGVLFPHLPKLGTHRNQRGRGQAGVPARGAWGRKCSNSDVPVRVEHFYPVPVCFGVIRELMQHPLGGYGGLKRGIGCTSLTWECCYPLPAGFVVLKREIEYTSRGECCSPSFPSGIPPPLGKSVVLLKCGIYFSFFLKKFEFRIEIIERRTE